MSGRLDRFAVRHQTALRSLGVILVIVLVGYVLGGAILSVVVGSQRESCKRGNTSRLERLRQDQQEEQTAVATIAAKKEQSKPGELWIAERTLRQVEGRIEVLKASVEDEATAPGAVTIECAEANPNPLQIGGG